MNTAEFLTELYYPIPHGYAEMRLIAEGTHHIKKLWREMPIDSIRQEGLARLAEYNQTHHIYHRVAISLDQRSTKADMHLIPALWLDIDDNSRASYDKLLDMPLYPNIIVASGGGFHAYWLLQHAVTCDSKRAWFEVERTMEGMMLASGIDAVDRKTKDITRILRTPGFYNIKAKYAEPLLCKVVFFDEARYTFDLLHRHFAPLGTPDLPQVRREIPASAMNGKHYPAWVQQYLQTGRTSGNRNSTLYGAALELRAQGYSQGEVEHDLLMRALADGLPQDEANSAIRSAFRRADVPSPIEKFPRHMNGFMAVEDNL